jgi:hypothetical protein
MQDNFHAFMLGSVFVGRSAMKANRADATGFPGFIVLPDLYK